MKKRKKIYRILLIILVIGLMTGCQSIDNLDFNESCLRCGEDIYFPAYLVKLSANIIQFVQLMVPVAIILVGMIELFKAVIASDENKMAESKNALIRKIISGILIYLVIAVVQFAFSAIPNFNDTDVDVFECMANFISGIEYSEACPERATGTSKLMNDDEHGLDPGAFIIEKTNGTIENCRGRNEDDCKSNEYYKCSWDERCEKCTSYDHQEVCNEVCYKCVSPSGVVTYTYTGKAPKNCTAVYTTSNGQKVDATSCEGLNNKANEENKENGACYRCDYGDYGSSTIVYEWKVKNNDSKCTEVSGRTPSNCGYTDPKSSKKCYRCEYSSGTIKYLFQIENPNSKSCYVVDYLTSSSTCNKEYYDKKEKAGNCWECTDGSYILSGQNPSDSTRKCGIAEDVSYCYGKKEPEDNDNGNPWCWRCNTKGYYEYIWKETTPSPKNKSACENITEITDSSKCNSDGYKEAEEAKKKAEEEMKLQKKNYGHCYRLVHKKYSTRQNYYWNEQGITAPSDWEVYNDTWISEYDCLQKWGKNAWYIEGLDNNN